MKQLHELRALQARKSRAEAVARLSPVLESETLYEHEQTLARKVERIAMACKVACDEGGSVPTATIDDACSAFECQLGIADAMIDRRLETLDTALRMHERIEGAMD